MYQRKKHVLMSRAVSFFGESPKRHYLSSQHTEVFQIVLHHRLWNSPEHASVKEFCKYNESPEV